MSMSWRRSAGSPPPASKFIACNVGTVVYLKPAQNVDQRHIIDAGIAIGALNHPAVITELDADSDYATVCVLTSFGLKSIQERYPIGTPDFKRQKEYIAVYPQAAVTPAAPQLHLAAGTKLVKESYLKISEPWRVHKSLLGLYYNRKEQLVMTETSVDIIQRAIWRNGSPPSMPVTVKKSMSPLAAPFSPRKEGATCGFSPAANFSTASPQPPKRKRSPSPQGSPPRDDFIKTTSWRRPIAA